MKKEEDLVKLWYHVDRTVKNYDNAELTPGLGRVVPEWHDKATGQVNLRPTSRELNRGNLEKRVDRFVKGDLEIVIAAFAMHSDGKVPDVQVEKAENGYADVRSLTNVRCVRCRTRQQGAPPPTCGGVFINQIGQLALSRGLLRRSRSGLAPFGYGRVLVTERRRVD